MNSEQRGTRSFLADVKIRKEKPCSLKRHSLGCLRQVIGLGEKLAANDPERFIWITERGFLPHARKKSQTGYCRRQVRYSLMVAERLGIFKPVLRLRRGTSRQGFIVVDHDSIAAATGGRCTLRNHPVDTSDRVPGQRRCSKGKASRLLSAHQSAAKDLQSSSRHTRIAFESAGGDDVECLSECRTERVSEAAEMVGSKVLAENTFTSSIQTCQQDASLEPSQPSQNSPALKNPMNLEPTSEASVSSPYPDLLEDQNRQPWVSLTTIVGEYFSELSAAKLEEVVERMSDQEFDVRFLDRYGNPNELRDCCLLAIEELKSQPFVGRKSCADVMGRAMELLRSIHNVNTPGGWLLAMRALRADSGPPRFGSAGKVCRDELAREIMRPDEVMSHRRSAIREVDRMDCGGALEELLKQNEELLAIMIHNAQVLGVPSCWPEALFFVNKLINELGGKSPVEVIRVREALMKRNRWLIDNPPRDEWEQKMRRLIGGIYGVPEQHIDPVSSGYPSLVSNRQPRGNWSTTVDEY